MERTTKSLQAPRHLQLLTHCGLLGSQQKPGTSEIVSLERSRQWATKTKCYRWSSAAILPIRFDTVISRMSWSSFIKLMRSLTQKSDDWATRPTGGFLASISGRVGARSKQWYVITSRPRGLPSWVQAETARGVVSNGRYAGWNTDVALHGLGRPPAGVIWTVLERKVDKAPVSSMRTRVVIRIPTKR